MDNVNAGQQRIQIRRVDLSQTLDVLGSMILQHRTVVWRQGSTNQPFILKIVQRDKSGKTVNVGQQLLAGDVRQMAKHIMRVVGGARSIQARALIVVICLGLQKIGVQTLNLVIR